MKKFPAHSSISSQVHPPTLPGTTPDQSVVDYLESAVPGLLQEILDYPTRLPTLEGCSSEYGGSDILFYSISKTEERDPLRALALLLLNANLSAIDLPYEHGQCNFSHLHIEGLVAKYKNVPLQLASTSAVQKAFEEIIQDILADYDKERFLDGVPIGEEEFLALNPMRGGDILCGYRTYDQKKFIGYEWFVETETAWVYWFWVGFL